MRALAFFAPNSLGRGAKARVVPGRKPLLQTLTDPPLASRVSARRLPLASNFPFRR